MVVHSEHERTTPLDWVVLVFEAILRMGCSKLGCKISTLGALSAGKTEAPPGSKMFLEMDISHHFMSYGCDYIRIYCALYCVRTFFVYGCVKMTRKCIIFAACRVYAVLLYITVSMRNLKGNLKCIIHIHDFWCISKRCIGMCFRIYPLSVNPNATNISGLIFRVRVSGHAGSACT